MFESINWEWVIIGTLFWMVIRLYWRVSALRERVDDYQASNVEFRRTANEIFRNYSGGLEIVNKGLDNFDKKLDIILGTVKKK